MLRRANFQSKHSHVNVELEYFLLHFNFFFQSRNQGRDLNSFEQDQLQNSDSASTSISNPC
jgi:hypothetical protein